MVSALHLSPVAIPSDSVEEKGMSNKVVGAFALTNVQGTSQARCIRGRMQTFATRVLH